MPILLRTISKKLKINLIGNSIMSYLVEDIIECHTTCFFLEHIKSSIQGMNASYDQTSTQIVRGGNVLSEKDLKELIADLNRRQPKMPLVGLPEPKVEKDSPIDIWITKLNENGLIGQRIKKMIADLRKPKVILNTLDSLISKINEIVDDHELVDYQKQKEVKVLLLGRILEPKTWECGFTLSEDDNPGRALESKIATMLELLSEKKIYDDIIKFFCDEMQNEINRIEEYVKDEPPLPMKPKRQVGIHKCLEDAVPYLGYRKFRKMCYKFFDYGIRYLLKLNFQIADLTCIYMQFLRDLRSPKPPSGLVTDNNWGDIRECMEVQRSLKIPIDLYKDITSSFYYERHVDNYMVGVRAKFYKEKYPLRRTPICFRSDDSYVHTLQEKQKEKQK